MIKTVLIPGIAKKATDIITLRDLLSEQYVFRIPDYQRGYAWHNEFIVLWQDILSYLFPRQ